MATKKYKVLNAKYGEVGSEETFAQIKKTAKENDADTDLKEDTRVGRDVVVDSHNVIVAEVQPEDVGKQGLTGGVVNRDRSAEQPAQPEKKPE